MELIRENKVAFGLMCGLVFIWGLDYTVAKTALELLEPLSLLFLRYCVGTLLLFAIKMKVDRHTIVRKKDIPFFLLCALTGEIMYFFCEYSAMDYLPVSVITMMLAFVPVVSIIGERVIFGRMFNGKMFIGILITVLGVALVIGADISQLMEGRLKGYLFAFGAIMAWNCYNFITSKVGENYTGITMSFNQVFCTILVLFPFIIHRLPPLECFTPEIVGGIIYLGVFSSGIGYFILIKGVVDLGPTISSMFSNFLPITATFFGWLFLGESVSLLQLVGGMIIIAASCLVIVEKGKMEVMTDDR